MSELRNEILLRLARVVLAGLIGALIYFVALGLGEAPSVTLALLCFLVGALLLQIASSNPL